MKNSFFAVLLLLFCSSLALAKNHHVPQNALDHGPNLPSVGSSLFDKIFSKQNSQGEAVYDVPYPLEKFFLKLRKMGGVWNHTMLPFSRSLQRPQDLSYDPLLNPRLVFAPSKDRFSITPGKLFVGFVKAKDQLEVISFNDEAGRFEYQLVKDYSRDPKVRYANRGKCLSCHQGQAGIFSMPQWGDTVEGMPGTLIEAKLRLQSGKLQNTSRTQQLFGNLQSREVTAFFDELIRESDDIAFQQRIWLHGCGKIRACRLGLLLATLAPKSRYSERFFKVAQQTIEQSPLKQQIHFHSTISKTDIGTEKVVEQYGSPEAVVNNDEALMQIISNLYNLSDKDNPATKRPISLRDKTLTPRRLATFTSQELEKIRSLASSPDQVAQILIDFYEADHPMFAEGALNKLQVMKELLGKMDREEAKHYSFWLTKKTPEKILFKGKLPPVFQSSQLNLMSRYCHFCHAAGLDFPPQFLLGSEVEVLAKVKGLQEKILFKLENGLMPPDSRDRQTMKDTGDLKKIIDFVRAL